MSTAAPRTLMHEHVTIDLSGVKQDSDCRVNCFSDTVDEFKHIMARGIGRIVDVTTPGMGRDVHYVSRVAAATGIDIVCATGYYKEPFLPPEVYRLDERALARKMIAELQQGIEETAVRAGVIGEIGSSAGAITAVEQKVFRAAAIAHNATGSVVTTHTTLGKLGAEQIELLRSCGVGVAKIIIGHADLSGDIEGILRMLYTGVTVAFDTIGKINYLRDERRADMLAELARRGLCGQVVLSLDITRASHYAIRGGIGYSYLTDRFLPLLRERGVNETHIERMLRDNPNRLLS